MRAVDRKLVRDLSRMKGQVITVALVVASGVAAYVSIAGTYRSLLHARDAYYERYRFPEVFARLERAPESLRDRIEALPGVARAETRVVQAVRIRMPGMAEPVLGQVVSLPPGDEPSLGAVMLRRGRMSAPGHADEVVVLEAFAEAHALELGQRLSVVIAGIERRLRVVGIALAPEYVFAIAPGETMPDARRFGVLWMERGLASTAFRMEGAFNDVVIGLQPGANERSVIDAVNRLLAPYGGLGAHGRNRQLSHGALRGELSQLSTLTAIMPTIFLGVAAFLINVVLSRLVQLQRAQIAVLKAVGYRRREVGAHYLKLVGVLVLGGSALGIALGGWLGQLLTNQYRHYFHFPALRFVLDARLGLLATGCALLSALLGALAAVASVLRLPAAEAMRPEQPAVYRHSLVDRVRISALFGESARMVLREIERRPLRLVLSSLAVAMAVAVLVAGRFNVDAIDWFMTVQFELAQREDVMVAFRRSVPERALRELAHLPGVRRVEGLRMLPIRVRNGHRARETVLLGYPEGSQLRRIVDRQGRTVEPGPRGVMLSSTLADILALRLGDTVELEPLEGERRRISLRVTSLIDDVYGLSAYVTSDGMRRLVRDEGRVSIALLRTDPSATRRLQRALSERPEVLAVNGRAAALAMFRKQTAGQLRFTTLIITLFAVVIAIGVIYNNARIALSTRSRDLASMRVLGFRRSEVSAILLGEIGVQVLLALLPGMYLGGLIAEALMAGADPEVYRFPVVISMRTYAFATCVTIGASLASALVVRRRIDQLDLIGVLKSRE